MNDLAIAEFLGLKPSKQTCELVRLAKKVQRLEDDIERLKSKLKRERGRCRLCHRLPGGPCRSLRRYEWAQRCPKCRCTIRIRKSHSKHRRLRQ